MYHGDVYVIMYIGNIKISTSLWNQDGTTLLIVCRWAIPNRKAQFLGQHVQESNPAWLEYPDFHRAPRPTQHQVYNFSKYLFSADYNVNLFQSNNRQYPAYRNEMRWLLCKDRMDVEYSRYVEMACTDSNKTVRIVYEVCETHHFVFVRQFTESWYT